MRHFVFVSGFSDNRYIDAVEVNPPDDNSKSYRISLKEVGLKKEDEPVYISVTLVLVKERR